MGSISFFLLAAPCRACIRSRSSFLLAAPCRACIRSRSSASLYNVERKIVGSRNFHLALSKEQVQQEDAVDGFIRPATAIVVDRLRLTQLRSDGRLSRSDEAA